MAKRGLQYVVDGLGRKKGVLLGMQDYLSMIRRLEELEDALELDEARRAAQGFRDYHEVRKQVRGLSGVGA